MRNFLAAAMVAIYVPLTLSPAEAVSVMHYDVEVEKGYFGEGERGSLTILYDERELDYRGDGWMRPYTQADQKGIKVILQIFGQTFDETTDIDSFDDGLYLPAYPRATFENATLTNLEGGICGTCEMWPDEQHVEMLYAGLMGLTFEDPRIVGNTIYVRTQGEVMHTPLPPSVLMLGAAVAGLGIWRRRRSA